VAGVKQAFAEFMADKPESLVEMPSTQCVLTKLQTIVSVDERFPANRPEALPAT